MRRRGQLIRGTGPLLPHPYRRSPRAHSSARRWRRHWIAGARVAVGMLWIAAALGGMATGVLNLNPSILASLQRDTPPPLHGRVMALAMFGALGLAPLSYGAAALLVPFGTTVLFVTAGLTLAAATAALAWPLLRGGPPVS